MFPFSLISLSFSSNLFRVTFYALLLCVLLLSCKKSYEPVSVEEELPPGYQQDIPWPSLADSPWPMNHGDPQSTGRSKYPGPINGILERVFETPELESGIVLGPDSTIYCSTSNPNLNYSGLYAFNINGKQKWRFASRYSFTTPLIGYDGTIYNATLFHINAINPDSTLKWEYSLSNYLIMNSINIGLDGTLYFIDQGGQLSVLGLDGILKWSLVDDKFMGSSNNALVFSPDGNTLYTLGKNDALLAIDISNKIIKWTFGQHSDRNFFSAAPIVDSQGHIYINAIIDSINSGQPSFFSINEDGSIRWIYHSNKDIYFQPTIDVDGNIYFATDTLFALDNFGNLKWKRYLGGYVDMALVCDINSIVYIGTFTSNLKVMAFDSYGNIIWNIEEQVYGILSSSPALGYQRLFIPTSNWYNFYSIK